MSASEKSGFARVMLWIEKTFWSCVFVASICLITACLLSGLLYGSGSGPPRSLEAFSMGLIAYFFLIPVMAAPSLLGGSIIMGIVVRSMRPRTTRDFGLVAGVATTVGMLGSLALLALDLFAFDRPPDQSTPNLASALVTSSLTYICILSALAGALALEYALRFLDPREIKEQRRHLQEADEEQARRLRTEKERQRQEVQMQRQLEEEQVIEASEGYEEAYSPQTYPQLDEQSYQPPSTHGASGQPSYEQGGFNPPPATPASDTRQLGSLQRYIDEDQR